MEWDLPFSLVEIVSLNKAVAGDWLLAVVSLLAILQSSSRLRFEMESEREEGLVDNSLRSVPLRGGFCFVLLILVSCREEKQRVEYNDLESCGY